MASGCCWASWVGLEIEGNCLFSIRLILDLLDSLDSLESSGAGPC